MKILFAADTPNSKITGIAKIMHSLAEALKAKGHHVDLLFREDVPRLNNFRRLSEFLFPLMLFRRIHKLWQGEGHHDIVALHSLAGFFYVFLRQWNKSLPPCVIVSYGADEMRWDLEIEEERLGLRSVRLFSKFFYYNIIIRQARYATRHTDHVMVAAKCEIDYFEKKYAVPRSQVTFIPNGVSPDYFISRDYSHASQRLLFLGGWEWRKGIRYLAEAFSLLAQEHPKLTLSLVGIGVSEKNAKELFSEKFHSRIRVTPRVTAPETIDVYKNHDIFVFPSLFESMSLVVPEAMAAGMPVVTTRACGMQDIIEDRKQGLLVTPRDSRHLAAQINCLLKDSKLAQTLGQAAQIKAKELMWNHIADAAENMYQSILERGAAS